MNDAEYIKALANQYQWSQIPEFVAHRERLLQIAAKLESTASAESEDTFFQRKLAEKAAEEEAYYQRKREEARTWKRGDKLRVIRREPNDEFQIGDIVYHCDKDGNTCPYVSYSLNGTCYAMNCTELEKI